MESFQIDPVAAADGVAMEDRVMLDAVIPLDTVIPAPFESVVMFACVAAAVTVSGLFPVPVISPSRVSLDTTEAPKVPALIDAAGMPVMFVPESVGAELIPTALDVLTVNMPPAVPTVEGKVYRGPFRPIGPLMTVEVLVHVMLAMERNAGELIRTVIPTLALSVEIVMLEMLVSVMVFTSLNVVVVSSIVRFAPSLVRVADPTTTLDDPVTE